MKKYIHEWTKTRYTSILNVFKHNYIGNDFINDEIISKQIIAWMEIYKKEFIGRIIYLFDDLSDTSLLLVIVRGGTTKKRWRLVGYDLYDYALFHYSGENNNLLYYIYSALMDIKESFQIDRIRNDSISPIENMGGITIIRHKNYSWNNSKITDKKDKKYRQLVSRWLRTHGGGVYKASESDLEALFNEWTKQKKDWLRSRNKRFVLSNTAKTDLIKKSAFLQKNITAYSLKDQKNNIAAIIIGWSENETFQYYLTSYNPYYRKCSPSILLLLSLMHEFQYKGINFMRGEEVYKEKFSNYIEHIVTIRSKS